MRSLVSPARKATLDYIDRHKIREARHFHSLAPKIAKPSVVFVLGGPGAGKGTMCNRIVRDYGYVHLSAGDLLREERGRSSDNAALINQYIREGKIVPVEITVGLLRAAMELHIQKGANKFLIDGFPRNQDNDEGWHRVMGDFAEISFVLYLECPEEVMQARLLERGLTSGRSDDNLESILKRFKTFQTESQPVIQKYEREGKVRHVYSHKPIPEVWEQVQGAFGGPKPQVVFVLGGPGAGKGTQCTRISEQFGFVHLSAGDLLRAEKASGSEVAKLINSYIKDGKIVPAEITVGLLKKAIESYVAKGVYKFLVDGFPRNANNVQGWESVMRDYCNLRFVLNFDCPEAVMEQRLFERGQQFYGEEGFPGAFVKV